MRRPQFLLLFLTLWSIVVSAKRTYDTDILTPETDYFEPKSIAFCALGGGSSHHFWILEMLKDLHARGHNVSLHTSGDQMVFGKDYPMIATFQLGKYDNFIMDMVKEGSGLLEHPTQLPMAFSGAYYSTKQYIKVFKETQEAIKERNINLVVADSFALGCADAAIDMNIPVVLTSTFIPYKDGEKKYVSSSIYTFDKPSAKDETLYKRIYNKLYVPFYIWKNTLSLKDVKKFQRQHGFDFAVDTHSKRYEKVTKMVNNAFGLEASRELGQLLHLVGPILRTSYPNMDEETSTFLSNHKRTVYVAFGQHIFPSKEDVRIVLYNLLKLKSEGLFDGIIWVRLESDLLPENLEIRSGKSKLVISKSDILNDPDILMLKWAPQYAILQHPSTIFFVGHGGTGSIHEALYSRVPLFIYPFFADQPYNGNMVKRLGVGEQIDTIQMKFTKKNYKLVYERLRRVLVDENDDIKNAVNRYANFLQISSRNSIQRGADLLEECVFSSDNQGHLNYRQDIKHEVNWIKRNSIDLYAIAFLFSAFVFVLISKSVMYHLSTYKKTKAE